MPLPFLQWNNTQTPRLGLQKRVKQIPKASAKYRVTTKEGTSEVENYMGECATDYHLHNYLNQP